MLKNYDVEFFIQCAILLIVFLTAIVGLFITIRSSKSRKRRDEELSRIMYSLMRRTQVLDDDCYALKEQNQQYADEIKQLREIIHSLGVLETKNANTISSLTSSINNTLQEYNSRLNEKIYPTPQLSEMISTTIGEFIRQEISMIRDMRIPLSPEDPVTLKIAKNTIKTYPHVDEDWICKKVIQICHEASRE